MADEEQRPPTEAIVVCLDVSGSMDSKKCFPVDEEIDDEDEVDEDEDEAWRWGRRGAGGSDDEESSESDGESSIHGSDSILFSDNEGSDEDGEEGASGGRRGGAAGTVSEAGLSAEAAALVRARAERHRAAEEALLARFGALSCLGDLRRLACTVGGDIVLRELCRLEVRAGGAGERALL